jgi:hypothetical protein
MSSFRIHMESTLRNRCENRRFLRRCGLGVKGLERVVAAKSTMKKDLSCFIEAESHLNDFHGPEEGLEILRHSASM